MSGTATLDPKFLIKHLGRDFVLYPGLLDMAHQMGLTAIITELVELPSKENGGRCVAKATATIQKDGVATMFSEYGDADPSNVNSMISKHLIRMALTRAKARALRDATNISVTAFEELDADVPAADEKKPEPKPQREPTPIQKSGMDKLQEPHSANGKYERMVEDFQGKLKACGSLTELRAVTDEMKGVEFTAQDHAMLVSVYENQKRKPGMKK